VSITVRTVFMLGLYSEPEPYISGGNIYHGLIYYCNLCMLIQFEFFCFAGKSVHPQSRCLMASSKA